MSRSDIRLIYQRFADAVNLRDFDALDDIFDPQLVNHGADPDQPRGAYHFKRALGDLVSACPDLRVLVDDLIVEGDKLVVRWTDLGTHTGAPLLGVPATGKQITLTGIEILRIQHGRIVERWAENDMRYLMETLGLI